MAVGSNDDLYLSWHRYTYAPPGYGCYFRKYGKVAGKWENQVTIKEGAFTNNSSAVVLDATDNVYLACGLPVIHNDYSELSAEIEKHEAGWALDPSDGDALRGLLKRLLREPELVAERGANARRWVADELNWEKTIEVNLVRTHPLA